MCPSVPENTRQAMVGFEIGISLPESREFYWSKIEREILRQEPAAPVAAAGAFWSAWRKFLVPAGAVSALALAALIGFFGSSNFSSAETAIADPGAFTYHDFSTRTTLVWFSYPAENEVADNEAAAKVE